MQVEVESFAKAIAAIVAAFDSFGAGAAFAKPFAARYFTLWLDRIDRKQKAETDLAEAALAKERALVNIAVLHERQIGVLENVAAKLDRLEGRLDRIEGHLNVPMTPSAVPAPPPAQPPPRRHLTDPNLNRVDPLPVPPPSSSDECAPLHPAR